MRELFRKIDFFILFLIGLALSFWAFLEKELFGCLILFLSSIVFSVSRWRFVYKNDNEYNNFSLKAKVQGKKWFFAAQKKEFKRLNYLFLFMLTLPILLIINNYFSFGLKDYYIVFGSVLFYIIFSSIMLIFKLKNNR